MTPMIDIVFQLIIFFLVCTEVASLDRVENLELPFATEAIPEEHKAGRLVISIDSKNQIWIGGRVRSLEEIERYLKIEKERDKSKADEKTSQPVLIQADKFSDWRNVQNVITIASKLQFWQLSFSAKKEQ